MSPAVEALVRYVEGLSGPVSEVQLAALLELAKAVRGEDPLAAEFERVREKFRARASRT